MIGKYTLSSEVQKTHTQFWDQSNLKFKSTDFVIIMD